MTALCTVRAPGGDEVHLAADGMDLIAARHIRLPGAARAVAGAPRTGRVLVLVDAPAPLVEIDLAGGPALVVNSAATQEPYKAGGARVTGFATSPDGRYVATALSGGVLVLHRLCYDRGTPTLEAVNAWPFGADTVVDIDDIAAADEPGDAVEEDDAAAPRLLLSVTVRPAAGRAFPATIDTRD